MITLDNTRSVDTLATQTALLASEVIGGFPIEFRYFTNRTQRQRIVAVTKGWEDSHPDKRVIVFVEVLSWKNKNTGKVQHTVTPGTVFMMPLQYAIYERCIELEKELHK